MRDSVRSHFIGISLHLLVFRTEVMYDESVNTRYHNISSRYTLYPRLSRLLYTNRRLRFQHAQVILISSTKMIIRIAIVTQLQLSLAFLATFFSLPIAPSSVF